MQTLFQSSCSIPDQLTARLLERRFFDALDDFYKHFLKSCSQEEDAASLPVMVIHNILNGNPLSS